MPNKITVRRNTDKDAYFKWSFSGEVSIEELKEFAKQKLGIEQLTYRISKCNEYTVNAIDRRNSIQVKWDN